MKINVAQNPEISRLFAARANPWAHKYDPAPWNDVSHTAYEIYLNRYQPVIERVAAALATPIDRPAKLAILLHKYDDALLHMLSGRPIPEMAVMRKNFMHFLSSTCLSTNCYAYGLDMRHGFRAGDLLTPGYRENVGEECSVPMVGKTISALFDGLAKDGLTFFNGDPNRDRPPEGFYLMALLVHHDEKKTGSIKDFHFIRYDRDGGCSHKLGHEYVSRSYVGKDIVDPTQPGTFGNYKYEGCLLVPAVLPQHQLMI